MFICPPNSFCSSWSSILEVNWTLVLRHRIRDKHSNITIPTKSFTWMLKYKMFKHVYILKQVLMTTCACVWKGSCMRACVIRCCHDNVAYFQCLYSEGGSVWRHAILASDAKCRHGAQYSALCDCGVSGVVTQCLTPALQILFSLAERCVKNSWKLIFYKVFYENKEMKWLLCIYWFYEWARLLVFFFWWNF